MPPDPAGIFPGERITAHILIPARNEAATIGWVVQGCIRAGFSVGVIDDGSSDETARLAMQAGAQVFHLPGTGQGKTAALAQGLNLLPDETEWLFFLDGDGQHDPADLKRFWNARAHADLLVGDRIADSRHMPRLRRWTNLLMTALLHRSGLRDSQCGFRLVRRSWLGSWRPVGRHFQFETEMALLAASQPCRVINLPIAATYGGEQSKIVPWRDALNFLGCLLSHRKALVQPRRISDGQNDTQVPC